jgi:predicted DsbA family dithiol-disulfide isomerase
MVLPHLFPTVSVARPPRPGQIRATMNNTESLFFYYDYVDPVSYILMRHLRAMEEIEGVAVEFLPLELVLPTHPILDPEEEEYRLRWERVHGEDLKLGVSLKKPWIVPWTRKAHELAFHAKERNSSEEIHEALFRAYLIESRDIGRIDVLVEIARTAGLDPLEAKAVLDVDRYKDAVDQARAKGLSAGCTVPPALIWQDRLFDDDPSLEALRSYFSSGTDRDTT